MLRKTSWPRSKSRPNPRWEGALGNPWVAQTLPKHGPSSLPSVFTTKKCFDSVVQARCIGGHAWDAAADGSDWNGSKTMPRTPRTSLAPRPTRRKTRKWRCQQVQPIQLDSHHQSHAQTSRHWPSAAWQPCLSCPPWNQRSTTSLQWVPPRWSKWLKDRSVHRQHSVLQRISNWRPNSRKLLERPRKAARSNRAESLWCSSAAALELLQCRIEWRPMCWTPPKKRRLPRPSPILRWWITEFAEDATKSQGRSKISESILGNYVKGGAALTCLDLVMGAIYRCKIEWPLWSTGSAWVWHQDRGWNACFRLLAEWQPEGAVTNWFWRIAQVSWQEPTAFCCWSTTQLLGWGWRNLLSSKGDHSRSTSRASWSDRFGSDLSTGWNFSDPNQRKQALDLIAKKKPAVLVLSPPCTTFSPLRRLSNGKRDRQQVLLEEKEGELHMDFSVSLAEMQINEGRGFILEQPAPATSWQRPKTRRLLQRPEVHRIRLDMCRFGLRAKCGPHEGELVQKPTVLATNIPEIAAHVNKVCQKTHRHGQLLGGAAKHAAIYTPSFVKALVNGIKEALGFKGDDRQPEALKQVFLFGKTLGVQARIYGQDCLEVDADVEMAYGFSPAGLMQEGQASTATGGLVQHDGFRDAAQLPTDGLSQHDGFRNAARWSSMEPGNSWTSAPDNLDFSKAVLPLSMDVDAPEEDADEDMVAEARRQMRLVGEQQGVANALSKVEDFQKSNEGEFSLAPNLRREVHRVHRNLGHPSLEIFLRSLQNAGVQDHIVSWTKKHFKCPTCEARPRPKPARPGHLMRALDFNTVVGIDLCFLDFKGQQFILLNMLCWGTNFQQAAICKDKSAEEILETLMKVWIQHYGPPVLLVMDRGKEFYNDKLQQSVGGLGVGLHYIDAQSPWQNSRTERAGGILKEKISATAQATSASTEEMPLVIAEVVACRNRYMDRFGFSPMQRVFGKNLRLPASLLSTDALNRDLVQASAGDPIHRAWEIREIASQEWLRRQDQAAVRRSIRAQSRTTDQIKIPIGSWVYVFRDSPSYKGWVGPGVTIAEDPSGRSTWISMRGRLWKASKEQLRLATPEEELGAELIVELSQDMLSKLQKPGHVVFQDVSAEGGPTDEYFDELMRTLNIAEEGAEQRRPASASSHRQSSSTSSTTGQTSSTSDSSPSLGNTEEGSTSANAAESEQPSRRASAFSELPEGPAPMETIPEDEAMDAVPIQPNVIAEPQADQAPLVHRWVKGLDEAHTPIPVEPDQKNLFLTSQRPQLWEELQWLVQHHRWYPSQLLHHHNGCPFHSSMNQHPCRDLQDSPFSWKWWILRTTPNRWVVKMVQCLWVQRGSSTGSQGQKRWSQCQMKLFPRKMQKPVSATRTGACMCPKPNLHSVRLSLQGLQKRRRFSFELPGRKSLIAWWPLGPSWSCPWKSPWSLPRRLLSRSLTPNTWIDTSQLLFRNRSSRTTRRKHCNKDTCRRLSWKLMQRTQSQDFVLLVGKTLRSWKLKDLHRRLCQPVSMHACSWQRVANGRHGSRMWRQPFFNLFQQPEPSDWRADFRRMRRQKVLIRGNCSYCRLRSMDWFLDQVGGEGHCWRLPQTPLVTQWIATTVASWPCLPNHLKLEPWPKDSLSLRLTTSLKQVEKSMKTWWHNWKQP